MSEGSSGSEAHLGRAGPVLSLREFQQVVHFQLVDLKECELGLSWQRGDFQVGRHFPVGEVGQVGSQSKG